MTLTLTCQGHSRVNAMAPLDYPYGFLLMVNSNIGPTCTSFRAIRPRNPGDLEFDLQGDSGSYLMVQLEPHKDFLLMYNNNLISISHRLAVIATRKNFFS